MLVTPVKGRLKLPGEDVDIPFTLVDETEHSLYGLIANTKIGQGFSKKSGWIFEADGPDLPTKTGSIIQIKLPGSRGSHWMLLDSGIWVSQSNAHKGVSAMRAFLARHPNFTVSVVA